MQDIISEIEQIANSGTLPDGDSVGTSTMIWAEDCVNRIKDHDNKNNTIVQGVNSNELLVRQRAENAMKRLIRDAKKDLVIAIERSDNYSVSEAKSFLNGLNVAFEIIRSSFSG